MCRLRREESGVLRVSQCWRPHQVSRIEAYESSEQCSMGIRLIIIELRKYNKVRELLIENGTTGSQAQVSYQDVVWEASVTREAVHMGVTEMGMQTGYRDACNQPPGRDPDQGHVRALWRK